MRHISHQNTRQQRTKRMLPVALAAALAICAGSAFAGEPPVHTRRAPASDTHATVRNSTHEAIPMLESGARIKSDLLLTDDDRLAIWHRLGKRRDQHKPKSFHAGIGAKLPPSIALHTLPHKLVLHTPELRYVRFAKVKGKVLLVDPRDRQIEQVIQSPHALRS